MRAARILTQSDVNREAWAAVDADVVELERQISSISITSISGWSVPEDDDEGGGLSPETANPMQRTWRLNSDVSLYSDVSSDGAAPARSPAERIRDDMLSRREDMMAEPAAEAQATQIEATGTAEVSVVAAVLPQ